MTRLLGTMLALLVSASILSIGSPAQAGAGASERCVTNAEYQAITKGQRKPAVTRLLDGPGTAAGPKARRYAKCGSRAKVVVTFTKKYSAPGTQVRLKRIVRPRATAPVLPATPAPGNGGSHAPVSTYACPSNAPIKGNEPSMIYHPPSSPWYDITTPEQCFASEAAAQAAGFRRAKY